MYMVIYAVRGMAWACTLDNTFRGYHVHGYVRTFTGYHAEQGETIKNQKHLKQFVVVYFKIFWNT